jgi:elongation factor P
MKAFDVKRGMVVEHDGRTWQVRDVQRSAPTGRGGNTTFRFSLYQIGSDTKIDLSLRADDELADVELSKRAANFSYMDGDNYVFLDAEDFTPYTFEPAQVPDLKYFLIEELSGCFALVVDEQPLALQLPQFVELVIVDTPPYLKGASATGRTKPAKLQTGLEIQVPEFIENGEKVRVSTETHDYGGRA